MLKAPRRLTGVVLVIATIGALAVLEPRADAAPPKFNLVLMVVDDQSTATFNQASMPFLARKASERSHWITFANAYVNTAQCCPSRATILTGRFSHHTNVLDNNDGDDLDESQTLATWLDAAGYRTGFFGKYLNGYPFRRGPYVPRGWDEWQAIMARTGGYYEYDLNENGSIVHYGSEPSDYSTDVLAAKASEFIETSSTPFFLYVAPKAPHAPAVPAPRHVDAPVELSHAPNFNEEDVSDKPAYVAAHEPVDEHGTRRSERRQERSLRAVDEALAGIVRALRTRRLLSTTVVLYTSDNGYLLGAHRLNGKMAPYEESVSVPFFMRHPNGSLGGVRNQLASNADVAATFTDLARTSPTIAQDGRSLVPVIKRSRRIPWRKGVLLEWRGSNHSPETPQYVPQYWGVRSRHWTYVEYDTGEKELYDLRRDPYQLTNVAGVASYSSQQARQARRLGRLRRS